VLATVVILAYRRWGMKEDITLLKGLLNILDFQQYSWYVNMYLGLYLMMPFLNALWRALEGREAQRTLLGALLLLTVLPSVLNIYDFVTEGALLRPWLTQTRYGLVPHWWRHIYPITYYYIGAYVRRNVDVKRLNTWKLLAFFCASVVFFGLFNIWRSYSIKFAEGPWEDWGGLQNTANALLLFLLINSIDYPTPN
jgi:surface polysaccharide O-acyltransferase-like enzyme